MSPQGEDWLQIARRIVEGDAAAFVRLSRVITGFLARWRAFDFQEDWDDLVQEVVLSAIRAVQGGRIETSGALLAYVRSAARNKLIDWVRRQQRRGRHEPPEEEGGAIVWPPGAQRDEAVAMDVRAALGRLPEKHREAVESVYVLGRTYDEAARETGIPLGSLKRYLRQGLVQLQGELHSLRQPDTDTGDGRDEAG